MFQQLNTCKTEQYFNIILIIFFLLGFVLIRFFNKFNLSKIQLTDDIITITNVDEENVKSKKVEEYLKKHQQEDEEFFYN